MVLSTSQMQALERRAFESGASAEALMEEAGRQIAAVVRDFFPHPGRCSVFFGKGHNGGDALVAARHLSRAGWLLELSPAFAPETWSPLTRRKYEELPAEAPARAGHPAGAGPAEVVLDGLLGIGASGPLREPVLSAIRSLQARRLERNAAVFALDLPTGLDGDTGAADPDAVRADFTLTIGFAKSGLLADGAAAFVGRLAVLPLEALTAAASPQEGVSVAEPRELARLLPRRGFDLHKGDCGRVTVLAGAPGMLGAAWMCAEACVRSGAGLVTLMVSREIYPLVAGAACPEVMVQPTHSYLEALDFRSDVMAIGPGLGLARRPQILDLISRVPCPMVVDADALNALSSQPAILENCAGPRLLTPHPGEMARLDPESPGRDRLRTLEFFTERFSHTLLLKGARTLVGQRGKSPSFNSTGSPGMASGGMGDVLTGVCAGLAAQGLPLYDAARLGAWLCGRAAELAIFRGPHSEESLSATAVLGHLGAAFKALRAGRW